MSVINPFLRKSVVIITLLISHLANANDWLQWRGPFLNGSTDEQNLPQSWSDTENIAWITPLPGPGGATPIIYQDKVFISSTTSTNDIVALCYNTKDSNKIWERTISTSTARLTNNNPTSPSPVTDGKTVIFLYGSGHIAGFDIDGNPLWSRNLVDDYGTLSINFGYSSSPLLFQDKLYIVVIRRDTPPRGRSSSSEPLESYLLALNPQTGDTIWKQPRPSNTYQESMESYTTPMPFNNNGCIEILNIGSDFITSNDPNDGKELWRYEYQTNKVRDSRIVPSLVTIDDLIIGARYKHHGVFALRPPAPDNSSQPEIAWELNDPSPDVCTPLYYNNRLYIMHDTRGTLACVEPKTGKVIWEGKINGRGPWRASPTGADDKIYCISESGQVTVLAAGDEFKVLFETIISETPIRSSIAIANSRVFIRSAKNLICIKQ